MKKRKTESGVYAGEMSIEWDGRNTLVQTGEEKCRYLPEKCLLSAVLTRAIVDACYGDNHHPEVRADAQGYLDDDDIQPISARFCCDVLFEDGELALKMIREHIRAPGSKHFHYGKASGRGMVDDLGLRRYKSAGKSRGKAA